MKLATVIVKETVTKFTKVELEQPEYMSSTELEHHVVDASTNMKNGSSLKLLEQLENMGFNVPIYEPFKGIAVGQDDNSIEILLIKGAD